MLSALSNPRQPVIASRWRGVFLYTPPMVVLMILCWITLAIAVVSLGVWAVVGWRLRRAMRSGLSIREHLDEDVTEEMVSIVVPAHNEARIIERCARGLLNQDWPRLEIIFVADRCTDETVEILRRTVADDPRVTIIENDACPDTWAGKCHAARVGAAGASGAYLVFMDADTLSAPNLVRAAVTSAKARGSSLLSLLTKLTADAIYERRTQTVASMLLLTLYPPDRVNREDSPRPFANGQFMFFDRKWYEKIGGHEAVRDDLLEDIAFSRCVSAAGGRVHLLDSDGLLECSMYSSSDAFRRGWQRIFIEACRRKPGRMRQWAFRMRVLGLLFPGLVITALLLGAIAWAQGETAVGVATVALAVGALLVQAAVLVVIYRLFHQSSRSIWRFPMGCQDVATILRGGASVLERREPVTWGGREYVLEPR